MFSLRAKDRTPRREIVICYRNRCWGYCLGCRSSGNKQGATISRNPLFLFGSVAGFSPHIPSRLSRGATGFRAVHPSASIAF
jgi:hypothetical protein